MRGGDEPKCARHKCRRAKTGIAVQSQSFPMSTSFASGAHGAVPQRIDRSFGRINRIDAKSGFTARESKIFTQLVANFLQQPIMAGEREIGDANRRWIAPSARATTSHNRNPLVTTARDEPAFVCQAIDGI